MGGEAAEPVAGQWICKMCSLIDDFAVGDPDSGIDADTPSRRFRTSGPARSAGNRTANVIPYREPELQAA